MADSAPEFDTVDVHVGGLSLRCLAAGPPDAELVLCLHGFPDSPHTFRHLLPALAAAGHRAVAPWMRGHPPSDLGGPYQSAALARDVLRTADALSPDRPVAIVGHDWGGIATYGACAIAPSRVSRAVVLAVPPSPSFRASLLRDWEQQRASWYQFLFLLGSMAEEIVQADDFAFIERLWRAWSPGWEPDAVALAAARSTVRAGFPTALDYYRDTWQPSRQDPALAADQHLVLTGPSTVPTLVLRGARDGCILAPAFAEVSSFFTGPVAVETFADVGHFLHLESPGPVNRRVLDFLDRTDQTE